MLKKKNKKFRLSKVNPDIIYHSFPFIPISVFTIIQFIQLYTQFDFIYINKNKYIIKFLEGLLKENILDDRIDKEKIAKILLIDFLNQKDIQNIDILNSDIMKNEVFNKTINEFVKYNDRFYRGDIFLFIVLLLASLCLLYVLINDIKNNVCCYRDELKLVNDLLSVFEKILVSYAKKDLLTSKEYTKSVLFDFFEIILDLRFNNDFIRIFQINLIIEKYFNLKNQALDNKIDNKIDNKTFLKEIINKFLAKEPTKGVLATEPTKEKLDDKKIGEFITCNSDQKKLNNFLELLFFSNLVKIVIKKVEFDQFLFICEKDKKELKKFFLNKDKNNLSLYDKTLDSIKLLLYDIQSYGEDIKKIIDSSDNNNLEKSKNSLVKTIKENYDKSFEIKDCSDLLLKDKLDEIFAFI